MIRKLLFFIMLIISPLPAFAATFTASVDDNHVVAGEGFALQLTLSGAEPKGGPDTGVLTSSFDIVSQGRTSETTIINGKMDSSIGWQLTLMPKKTGQVVVPPITINTDSGNLSTQPVMLDVGGTVTTQPLSQSGNPAGNRGVMVTATVSSSDPYQNQPIIYTVRVIARADVSGISPGNVVADGAIIEPLGKPEIQDQTENGVPVKVIELHYIVTPMQAKTITIEPTVIQGNMQTRSPVSRLSHMGNGFPDPFDMLQEMDNFSGFMTLRPFDVASNPVVLNVKPPAVAMDPWLPLQNLQVQEKMDLSQPVKVGDSINRKITLLAYGATSSQLPALAPQQDTSAFKVYADKPIFGDSVDETTGNILGSREENDSLIPQTAGQLKLPAIRIPWWDIKNNRVAYAELPEHTVNVLPSLTSQSAAPVSQNLPPAVTQAIPVLPQVKPLPVSEISWFWAALTAFLSIIILAIAAIALHLNQKVKRLSVPSTVKSNMPKPGPVQSSSSVQEIKWDQIKTPEDMNRELLAYAHKRWRTPSNAALETVFESQRQKLSDPQDVADIQMIVQNLTAALYARKDIDLEDLKDKCRRMIAILNRPAKDSSSDREKLPDLNPS